MNIDIYIFGNSKTPSSRLRWINYKDDFKKLGININIYELNDYVYKRILLKSKIKYADIIIIQKSFINQLILKEFKNSCKTLIYDIDDAIWLNHPGINKNNLNNIIKTSIKNYIFHGNLHYYDKIIVSNNYLKDYISKHNNNVYVVPTSPTDFDDDSSFISKDSKFIVGWSGTGQNLIYIRTIEKNIKDFFIKNKNAYLMIVSDDEYVSKDVEFNKKIINVKWNMKTESQYIKNFDIGIMPLIKDEWSLGKAAYKLIYYMKYKIPTVSTNWGFQTEFIENEHNGFLVNGENEWSKYLEKIYNDNLIKNHIGIEGYNTYLERFSMNKICNLYLNIMDTNRVIT